MPCSITTSYSSSILERGNTENIHRLQLRWVQRRMSPVYEDLLSIQVASSCRRHPQRGTSHLSLAEGSSSVTSFPLKGSHLMRRLQGVKSNTHLPMRSAGTGCNPSCFMLSKPFSSLDCVNSDMKTPGASEFTRTGILRRASSVANILAMCVAAAFPALYAHWSVVSDEFSSNVPWSARVYSMAVYTADISVDYRLT